MVVLHSLLPLLLFLEVVNSIIHNVEIHKPSANLTKGGSDVVGSECLTPHIPMVMHVQPNVQRITRICQQFNYFTFMMPTSNGCVMWVLCGGKPIIITWLSLADCRTAGCTWPKKWSRIRSIRDSSERREAINGKKASLNHATKMSLSIHALSCALIVQCCNSVASIFLWNSSLVTQCGFCPSLWSEEASCFHMRICRVAPSWRTGPYWWAIACDELPSGSTLYSAFSRVSN